VRKTERKRERVRERETKRERERGSVRERESERERETVRDNERQRETTRERETKRERERETNVATCKMTKKIQKKNPAMNVVQTEATPPTLIKTNKLTESFQVIF